MRGDEMDGFLLVIRMVDSEVPWRLFRSREELLEAVCRINMTKIELLAKAHCNQLNRKASPVISLRCVWFDAGWGTKSEEIKCLATVPA
jgi:hypothetical protein